MNGAGTGTELSILFDDLSENLALAQFAASRIAQIQTNNFHLEKETFPTLLGGFVGQVSISFLVAVCPDYDYFIVPPPKISPHQSGLFHLPCLSSIVLSPSPVNPSPMITSACVSGLFLITADFSSEDSRAVAHLSLENPLGDNSCAAIATMFLCHPSSRRIGFEGQYAYVSGPVALSINSSTHTPYFDVRGAFINPLTSYTPSSSDDEISEFIDDSNPPPVLRAFRAYNFALTTFHIVGMVVEVYGEPGSQNFRFILSTGCLNGEVC